MFISITPVHAPSMQYLILKVIVLGMYVLAMIMPGKGHCGKNLTVVRCIFVSLIVSYTYVAATYVKGNMDKYPHFIICNRMYVLMKSLEKTHKAIKLLSYYVCRLQYHSICDVSQLQPNTHTSLIVHYVVHNNLCNHFFKPGAHWP